MFYHGSIKLCYTIAATFQEWQTLLHMTESISRSITSNQKGPHDKLYETVTKHLETTSQKPIQDHTLEAFNDVTEWLADWDGPIVLDSCCGVGESTASLASKHQEAKVVGLDKSAVRINKHEQNYHLGTENHLVIRADVIDFWRLVVENNWPVSHHYLLYPNPYPKSAHLKRRWHGSAAFADLIKVGGQLEVRSNWQTYIEEFSLALKYAGYESQWEQLNVKQPMTPFERKYTASGQNCWSVKADLNSEVRAS